MSYPEATKGKIGFRREELVEAFLEYGVNITFVNVAGRNAFVYGGHVLEKGEIYKLWDYTLIIALQIRDMPLIRHLMEYFGASKMDERYEGERTFPHVFRLGFTNADLS